MASKFVRSVKDIYNLENFNTNLVDENDICINRLTVMFYLH
ncbi:tail protein [Staphylococcus phage S-CoN_Ph35]|nr:tail protein [Staphylococcus phage S-CoN_Ph35]